MASVLPGRAACATPMSAEALLSRVHHLRAATRCRSLSTSAPQLNKRRDEMWTWIHGPGRNFQRPQENGTNYVTMYNREGKPMNSARKKQDVEHKNAEFMDAESEARDEDGPDVKQTDEGEEFLKPFPLNPDFVSQKVLSEELREEIWRRLRMEGKSVRRVSTELNVSMVRVAAVFRLKEVEKRWVKENKRLANDYTSAILSMLPKTPYTRPDPYNPPPVPKHEPINDLPVHPITKPQLFEPVPESRHYTRLDAAKAFDPAFLPADARLQHPELIALEEDRLAGVPREERARRMDAREAKEVKEREARVKFKAEREAEALRVLPAEGRNRWEWRVRDVSVEAVGKDGRGVEGVGRRYGVPHEDRKKGQVKLPTRIL